MLACARTCDENVSVFPRKQISKQNKQKHQQTEENRKILEFWNSMAGEDLIFTGIQHDSDQCDSEMRKRSYGPLCEISNA